LFSSRSAKLAISCINTIMNRWKRRRPYERKL
jgi:hypothetical protein